MPWTTWARATGNASDFPALMRVRVTPIESAYDFSFAKKADSELTQAGWKP
jgi:hypothetical protein